MAAVLHSTRVLVGPRSLNRRICRLLYLSETDEAWTEVWNDHDWERVPVLARLVLNAPSTSERALSRRGIPLERGEWDQKEMNA